MHQVEIATTEQSVLDAPEMTLNMGPQHPSTHGVLRVVLKLDGETVIDLDCDIGYLHRGMEKIAENRMYPMIAPYWDRLDYIAAVSNGLVWVETVERVTCAASLETLGAAATIMKRYCLRIASG